MQRGTLRPATFVFVYVARSLRNDQPNWNEPDRKPEPNRNRTAANWSITRQYKGYE